MDELLPAVLAGGGGEALRAAGRSLTYGQLRDAASAVAALLDAGERVAVWAEPALETCAGVVGTLLAGAVAVPVNPRTGTLELSHVLRDAAPRRVLAGPKDELPGALASLERIDVDLGASGRPLRPEPGPDAPALVFFTSGTTGPPKGAVIPRRALATNLDAQAAVWEWTSDDVLTHGLPLHHVHGLVLGVLGSLRTGGRVHHVGRFLPHAIAQELAGEASMLFAVPTMHRDLADAAEADPAVAGALARARLLVSGSAPLPHRDWARIERATGQRIVQRYGLTETLMNCAVPASSDRRPGTVGPPLPGVEVGLIGGGGVPVEGEGEGEGEEPSGEVLVRGPNVFLGYLNRPDATRNALRDGWFHTGDVAIRDEDGWYRIVGRRDIDLIKTGGHRVGAGEVEAALLDHSAVSEAAVTGEPDDRLGQRIVAWVVLRPEREATATTAAELEDHVAATLAPHKRPRVVRFVDALPRNEMGKIVKTALRAPGAS
ncbi:MAG: AMP-binding protein [Actinomycetota bacterium]|nr:AMP-binding protein [Actinomycetota bacterium]